MTDYKTFEFNGETYGMIPTGLKVMRLAECLEFQKSLLKGVFGDDTKFNLEPDSKEAPTKFGQLAAAYAEREADIFELIESVYNANDPDMATGERLAKLCKQVGVYKEDAKKTLIDSAVLTGSAGTVIQAGALAKNSVTGEKAELLADVEIVDGGSPAIFQALNYGPKVFAAGTLSIIETPRPGWTAVTNTKDGTVGRIEELDSELKQRREKTLKAGGSGRIDTIKEAVDNLDGTTYVVAYENDTSEIDARGQAPNSINLFVVGGDDAEIAQALWDNKPGAIPYVGNTGVTITDSQGFNRVMRFSRPEDVLIWIILQISVNDSYPENGDDQAKTGLLEKGILLDIGDDVIVDPYLKGAIAHIPGITSSTILIGTAENPTQSDNIIISDIQGSVWDSAHIQVVHV